MTNLHSSQQELSIQEGSKERGIERLCHFTRLASLPLILESGGLCSQQKLSSDGMKMLANDPDRLDGYLDHISLSITYPNVFVLSSYVQEMPNIPWIITLWDPDPLWWPNTCFSPVNAARKCGSFVKSGSEAFDELFSRNTDTPGWTRSKSHCRKCPNDVQAEVLVRTHLPIGYLTGIVAPTTEIAHTARLILEGWPAVAERIHIFSCRDFFDEKAITDAVRKDVVPAMIPIPKSTS
jgi:ssDNA thymidine ADP-ribosyltransferase, DarT